MKADPTKTRLLQELKHTSPLISCRFDPTGRFALAGAQDNTVQRWDLATGQAAPLIRHESWVRAIAFSPDGQTAYTAGYDGRLVWWPVADSTPQPVRVVEAHQGWVRCVATSPDGSLIATAGNDRLIKLWSAADGAFIRELAGHEHHVYNVAFHPQGQALASCDLKGVVKHWDLSAGSPLRQLDAGSLHKYDETFRADVGGARAMSFSRDGKVLACGGMTNVTNAFAGVGNPAVVLLDWETGTIKQQHRPAADYRGVTWGLAFHPDGYLISASGGGGGGYLLFWKPEAANEFFQFKLPNSLRDFDLHPDGLRMAVAHYDSHLRIYTLEGVG